MVEALVLMGGLGLIIGAGLAAASKIFYVYVDPKIIAVEEALPGANCGGCGLPGCSSNAEAIVAGKAAPNSCVAAGPEVAEAIAAILGVSVEAKEPDIASPGCTYGVQDADIKYFYDGLADCKAAALLSGGMKVCSIGCLGLGSCVNACQFGALSIGSMGLPVVNEKLCTGCGACERACPKNIITLSSVTRRILMEYTSEMCTTPCQRACPAGINISGYIKAIDEGDYQKAVRIIKERNPFPTVIGRICPRPCEVDCRRQYVDEPVAINFLKRFVSDYEREAGERILPYKAPETGKKAAVIGGGIEGLSTAFFLARLGHEPTVFEATSGLGGLLRTAIAKERLPKEILDWDIEGVVEMGVRIETGKTLGKDFSIASLLKNGFEAVFLAGGGWDSRLARGIGTDLDITQPIPGTYLLIDILKSDSDNIQGFSCDSDVVIAGGGKLAVEAADICKKSGAVNISILLRETRALSMIDDKTIARMENEGINLIFNVGINRISGEAESLVELEYTELGSEYRSTLAVQTLIVSSGRFPELIFTESGSKGDESENSTDNFVRWNGMEPYKPSPDSTNTGFLSEIDVLTDYSAAVKAIGAGRRAAASIHKIMYGISLYVPVNLITPESLLQNVYHVEGVKAVPRQIMPLCTGEECIEIEKGFTEDMARKEAARCLSCGLVCYMKKGDKEEESSLKKVA